MQLEAPRLSSIRGQLGAAACLLLAAGTPAAAQPDAAATWQFDGSALLYGENQRATVVEPVARITRLFPDGQTLSAQLGIDAITGASPSGAMPSGTVQTTTSASGSVQTLPAGQIPLSSFRDVRGALDLEWLRPIAGLITTTTGAHVSREKDYQSLGANATVSVDVMHRLTTLTAGAGFNRDGVFPVGGTPAGLSDGSTLIGSSANPKRVTTTLLGLSRVLTRRWMMGVDLSRTFENGYLTEPYKVVSLLDDQGLTTGQLTEKRPTTRDRKSVLVSSVYHLARQDALHLSYRYYWDTWGIRSHAVDAKYWRDLPEHTFIEPHLRLYAQRPADFFVFGLRDGAPLPDFATSDGRLGSLRTVTLGATYGFRLPGAPGEWSVRGEYIRQWGQGHPADAIGVQREFDLLPPLDIGSLVVGYSVSF